MLPVDQDRNVIFTALVYGSLATALWGVATTNISSAIAKQMALFVKIFLPIFMFISFSKDSAFFPK